MKTIEEEIARIISRAAMIPESKVTPDAKLSDLGLTSLDHVESVFAVEEMFQLEINESNLWQMHTVQDVIDAVKAALAMQSR